MPNQRYENNINSLFTFNFDSQMINKISYRIRRTKAHSKSFDWLNKRLANLKGHKINI